MGFDLNPTVPADAIIDSAILKIYLESGTADGAISITATNLVSDWVETEVTYQDGRRGIMQANVAINEL